jgi:ribonuclease HII
MHKFTPDWHYEAQYGGPVAGIDEAGRGPLAGPVIAASVILDENNIPPGLNDSKKLSPTKRDILYEYLFECAHIGIGIAEPEEIDRLNILGATMAAMARSVTDLSVTPIALLIDGNKSPKTNIPSQTIIKGDAKSLSIAAASIIAKVTRDRLMVLADIRFPGYGFSRHKGYPTALHRGFLHDLGASPLHRRSYAPVKAVLT